MTCSSVCVHSILMATVSFPGESVCMPWYGNSVYVFAEFWLSGLWRGSGFSTKDVDPDCWGSLAGLVLTGNANLQLDASSLHWVKESKMLSTDSHFLIYDSTRIGAKYGSIFYKQSNNVCYYLKIYKGVVLLQNQHEVCFQDTGIYKTKKHNYDCMLGAIYTHSL